LKVHVRRQNMTKGFVMAAAAAFFAALALAGTASAQYPPPSGSLVCTISVNTALGETSVSATLRDSAGRPVAGKPVHFKIESGKGQVSQESATTNSAGVASVVVAGTGVSFSAYSDDLACSSAALGVRFIPPGTGDAGLLGSGASTTEAVAAGIVVLSAAGVGMIAMRRRTRAL
jgi:hypothetical protein